MMKVQKQTKINCSFITTGERAKKEQCVLWYAGFMSVVSMQGNFGDCPEGMHQVTL
jgi:hypothetical protein